MKIRKGMLNWFFGFVCGVVAGITVYIALPPWATTGKTSHNLIEGGLKGAGLVFTLINIGVCVSPFFIFKLRREWFASCFSFVRRLPTMIGMLGTLWSLIESDMTNPGSLAQRFSVAIVSTFFGLILQIVLDLAERFRFVKNELDRKNDVDEE